MNSEDAGNPKRLLRLGEIISPAGPLPISRSTWFEWVKEGRVPQPIKLGPRVTAYRRSEIEAYIDNPENWMVVSEIAPATEALRNAKWGAR